MGSPNSFRGAAYPRHHFPRFGLIVRNLVRYTVHPNVIQQRLDPPHPGNDPRERIERDLPFPNQADIGIDSDIGDCRIATAELITAVEMIFQHLKGIARHGLRTYMIARPIELGNRAVNGRAIPHFFRSEGEPLGQVRLSDRIGRQPGIRRIVFARVIDKDDLRIPHRHFAIFKRRHFSK